MGLLSSAETTLRDSSVLLTVRLYLTTLLDDMREYGYEGKSGSKSTWKCIAVVESKADEGDLTEAVGSHDTIRVYN